MNALQHTLIALSLGVAASTSFAAPLSNGSFANGLTGWSAIGDVAATGAPSARGGVPANETLLAAGKTLCAAAGLSREATEATVAGGRVIEAALQPA